MELGPWLRMIQRGETNKAQRKVSMEGLPEQTEIAGPNFCEDVLIWKRDMS